MSFKKILAASAAVAGLTLAAGMTGTTPAVAPTTVSATKAATVPGPNR